MKKIILFITIISLFGCKNEPVLKDSFTEVIKSNERFTLSLFRLFKENNIERLKMHQFTLNEYESILRNSDEPSDRIEGLIENYDHPSMKTLAQVNELLYIINESNLSMDNYDENVQVEIDSDNGNISFRSNIILRKKQDSTGDNHSTYRFWVFSKLLPNGDFKFTKIIIF